MDEINEKLQQNPAEPAQQEPQPTQDSITPGPQPQLSQIDIDARKTDLPSDVDSEFVDANGEDDDQLMPDRKPDARAALRDADEQLRVSKAARLEEPAPVVAEGQQSG